ncbi:hypothetical protein NE237_003801 [Protea cynaroides]|uniref:Uncharacterized protein n=1 Tax=Protea cynaroides TaxID=273540 RepID=A0A9Q0KHM4_9MAGN|nr:hypothetical protein NE237_003801 [Protea cynaroides]
MSLQNREVVMKNWSTTRFLVPHISVYQNRLPLHLLLGLMKNQKTQLGMQWDTIKRPKGLKVIEDPQQNLYNIECDVVIVGAGCSGGFAGGVLVSAGEKIIVLDKGNYFVPEDYSSLEDPSLDQK